MLGFGFFWQACHAYYQMPGTTRKHKESQGIWVGSQRSLSSQTASLLGSPLRTAGPASWEPCFFQGFSRIPGNREFSSNHQRQSWVYIISTPGTTRKHKEFQGFRWDPSAVSHRGLEASMDRPCALPALQAGNLHFPSILKVFRKP